MSWCNTIGEVFGVRTVHLPRTKKQEKMVTDPSKASSLDPNKIKEEGKREMDAEDTRDDFVDEQQQVGHRKRKQRESASEGY